MASKTSRQIIWLVVSIILLSSLFGLLLRIKLLRLLPVISSIVSLQFAYDEYAFLSCWTISKYRVQANELLPFWFTNWGPWGTNVVFGTFTLSLASGIANTVTSWNGNGARSVVFFYFAGTLLAAGHLLIFGPKAIDLLARIRCNDANASSMASLELWLEMHLTRSLVLDLPAVGCFITGLLLATESVI